MKAFYPLLATLALSLVSARAVDAEALLIIPDDIPQRVWVTAASPTNIEYKTTEVSVDRKRIPRSSVDSVYFFQPKIYKEAINLYRNRDYSAAQEKFAATKEAFKRVEELPGNYSTLGAFYELECARKLGDLEQLSTLLESYLGGALMRESDRQQQEVYAVWDAVRTKSWPRLEGLTTEMLSQSKWTGSQLAQIYYGRGLAMEALGKPLQALNAFNGAFTADFTASEEITTKAALACLRVIDEHDEVRLAREQFGTEDEDPNSEGHRLLLEGAALCGLWDKALGAGKPLPEKYKGFLKYKKKSTAPAAPAADKKPADKKP